MNAYKIALSIFITLGVGCIDVAGVNATMNATIAPSTSATANVTTMATSTTDLTPPATVPLTTTADIFTDDLTTTFRLTSEETETPLTPWVNVSEICPRLRANGSHDNETLTFPATASGSVAYSDETCQHNGYSASVKCSGSIFEWTTLKVVSCASNASELFNKVDENQSPTAEAVVDYTEQLNALSRDLSLKESAQQVEEVKKIADTVRILAQNVNNKETPVKTEAMENVLQITDKIHAVIEKGYGPLSDTEKANYLKAIDQLADNLNLEGGTYETTTASSIFKATKIKTSTNVNVTFDDSKVSSTIPASVITTLEKEGGYVKVIFYHHKDAALFPQPCGGAEVHQVINVKIAGVHLVHLGTPVIQNFSHSRGNDSQEHCAFFDFSVGKWSYRGCKTKRLDGATQCECNHLTNFAVLVSDGLMNNAALDVFGDVGCSLSAIALCLLLAIYLTSRKLREVQINQVHIHLCACLLVAYVTFLIGVERNHCIASCILVAVILHFSFLSAWGWMLAESITMFRKFVLVFSHIGRHYVAKLAAIVYSLSALVTMLTAVIAHGAATDQIPSPYVSDHLCWLKGNPLYFGFLTPVCLMLLTNWIVGGIIMFKITTKDSTIRSSKQNQNEAKTNLFRVITVSTLLGLTWIFAVPLIAVRNSPDTHKRQVEVIHTVFGWLFSISNAVQGVYLFFVFAVKPDDVRNIWLGAIQARCGCVGIHKREVLSSGSSPTLRTKVISAPVMIDGGESYCMDDRYRSPDA